MALYVLIWLGGIVVIICGALFSIIVMGGATRTLVAHLLWNEPVTVRATYRAVKSRFWGLLGASALVAVWLAKGLSVTSVPRCPRVERVPDPHTVRPHAAWRVPRG